jgi:hypothetical protein
VSWDNPHPDRSAQTQKWKKVMTAARQMSTFHTQSNGDWAPSCCCRIWGQKVLAGGGHVGQNPLILKNRICHRLPDACVTAKTSIEGFAVGIDIQSRSVLE